MIGCFDLPQTQKERHAVRMEAAVSGEERCVTTLKTAAQETKPYTVVKEQLSIRGVNILSLGVVSLIKQMPQRNLHVEVIIMHS